MTASEFTDRYHFLLQHIYETIGRLDPLDLNLDETNPTSALRKMQDVLRAVEHDLGKLAEEIDRELETATKRASIN